VFTITTNSHVSHILRLAMCAAISIVGFWCPFLTAYQYAEYDHRMGGVMCFALPFLILAAYFSIILLHRLIRGLKAVRAKWRYLVGFFGVILAIPSILAVILMVINIVFAFCFAAIYTFRKM